VEIARGIQHYGDEAGVVGIRKIGSGVTPKRQPRSGVAGVAKPMVLGGKVGAGVGIVGTTTTSTTTTTTMRMGDDGLPGDESVHEEKIVTIVETTQGGKFQPTGENIDVDARASREAIGGAGAKAGQGDAGASSAAAADHVAKVNSTPASARPYVTANVVWKVEGEDDDEDARSTSDGAATHDSGLSSYSRCTIGQRYSRGAWWEVLP
jgi:hypothetical protein